MIASRSELCTGTGSIFGMTSIRMAVYYKIEGYRNCFLNLLYLFKPLDLSIYSK
jgi:hypothetical protein